LQKEHHLDTMELFEIKKTTKSDIRIGTLQETILYSCLKRG